jgi:pilus assembly protein CpaD
MRGKAMTTRDLLRFASLAAVLLAGSCAQPGDINSPLTSYSPTDNYPITVAPGSETLHVSYVGPTTGMSPEDSAAFDAFIAQYVEHGSGAISVSVPQGPAEQSEITYFGERLFAMGVDRARILVGTHAVANGDGRVEVNFVQYKAETKPCGDWSVDVAEDAENTPMPNFGCSVQHNIAAMVADPRDLIAPRPMSASDANRRETVMGHYEKGEVTQADKHTVDKAVEQSGVASDTGN